MASSQKLDGSVVEHTSGRPECGALRWWERSHSANWRGRVGY